MEGYHKLASWMSRYPEIAILRSFRTLNMQTLLYQQAELIDLEANLQQISLANKNDADPRKRAYERNMWALSRSADDGCDLQLQLTQKIQEKLQSYYGAMLQQNAVLGLYAPSDRELNFLRGWLDHPSKGKSFLEDLEKDTWAEENRFELVSLHKKDQDNDILSQWVKGKLLYWFHRLIGHKIKDPILLDPEGGTAYYDDKKIRRVISVICHLFAILVVILPIFILKIVSNPSVRLWIVVAFIGLSPPLLAVATTVSRSQIWATTLAYAAVQVVFIVNT